MASLLKYRLLGFVVAVSVPSLTTALMAQEADTYVTSWFMENLGNTEYFNSSPSKSVKNLDLDHEYVQHGHIKTNAVGWALAQINFAFEFDMGPHWSLNVPFNYSGWNYFVSDIKFRTFNIKPSFRYWLRRSNTGLYLGIHTGYVWFNYAFKGVFRYSNRNHAVPAFGGGVSVGYRMPLTRDRRWNMEFGAAFGAYYVDYAKHYNVPNGALAGEKTTRYYGPDGVSVTFLYSFDFQ